MKFHGMFFAAALVVAGTAMASAPASTAAKAAATTVASAPAPAADYSTPAAATKSYLRALYAGNSAAVYEALIVPNERKADLDAILSLTVSMHWLQEAAADRFKGDGDKLFYGDPKTRVTLAAQLKAVDDDQVDVSGDTATLTLPAADASQEAQKISLKKIGAAWKLDAVTLYSLDSDKTAARVALSKKLAAVTDATLKDLTAGKFGSATEASQEYWTRMAEASKALAATTSAAK